MTKQSPSEELDKIVGRVLGRLGAPLGRIKAARPSDAKLAAAIEVIDGLRDLPRPDFKGSLKADLQRRATMATPAEKGVNPIREGFRTITPYITVNEAPDLVDFVKNVFAAEEVRRSVGSAGGLHCEVKIGDSMLMIGGGLKWRGTPLPTALHVDVPDVDAVYDRAIQAGATPIQPPSDQDYGSRDGSVQDLAGNHWYISTLRRAPGGRSPQLIPEAAQTVTAYLHPVRGSELIDFLKKAFGADVTYIAQSPNGAVHHARLRIGDSSLEMGDAHGPYQPMPTAFFLYVRDVDALHARAVEAGAASTGEPSNQPYGDRVGGVQDPFGNQWWIATHIADAKL